MRTLDGQCHRPDRNEAAPRAEARQDGRSAAVRLAAARACSAGMTINTLNPKPTPWWLRAPLGAGVGAPFGASSSMKLEIWGAAAARPCHFAVFFEKIDCWDPSGGHFH